MKWAFCCMTYILTAWLLSPHNHLVYCGGGNGYFACLHCLCGDFINFLWPFKTFKTAATLQLQCL